MTRSSRRPRHTTPPAFRSPRPRHRPVSQPVAARQDRRIVAVVAALLVLGVLTLGVIWYSTREDEGATSATPNATPVVVRQTDVDRRLAQRDNTEEVAPYSAVLDGLERKLRQRRQVIADCAVSGTTTLSEKGVSMTTLQLLQRMNELTPEPTPGPIVPGYALTCADVVRVIVGTTSP